MLKLPGTRSSRNPKYKIYRDSFHSHLFAPKLVKRLIRLSWWIIRLIVAKSSPKGQGQGILPATLGRVSQLMNTLPKIAPVWITCTVWMSQAMRESKIETRRRKLVRVQKESGDLDYTYISDSIVCTLSCIFMCKGFINKENDRIFVRIRTYTLAFEYALHY